MTSPPAVDPGHAERSFERYIAWLRAPLTEFGDDLPAATGPRCGHCNCPVRFDTSFDADPVDFGLTSIRHLIVESETGQPHHCQGQES